MKRTVFVYVFDTMADWEIGFLTAELNSKRYFKKDAGSVKVVTLGAEKSVVTSMGGLKILPDIELDECKMEIKEGDVLILPGGETWLEGIHHGVLDIVAQCIEKNIIVAAICGATMALAQGGFLNTRNHTSNDLGYLKMVCLDYKGESHYIKKPSVTDGNLITATGIAPLEFTASVLKALDVLSPQVLEAWLNLYKTNDEKYFYEIMKIMV